MCRFVHLHTYRPAKGGKKIRLKKNKRGGGQNIESTVRSVELYCRGGELGSTAASPSDEEDKSAGFSAGGGVLGTRSGLSDCTPENKDKKQKRYYSQ